MAMNESVAELKAEDNAAAAKGRVVRVQGSVIDVEFPVGHLPDIYDALTVRINNVGATEG